jgi:hypothetical protein
MHRPDTPETHGFCGFKGGFNLCGMMGVVVNDSYAVLLIEPLETPHRARECTQSRLNRVKACTQLQCRRRRRDSVLHVMLARHADDDFLAVKLKRTLEVREFSYVFGVKIIRFGHAERNHSAPVITVHDGSAGVYVVAVENQQISGYIEEKPIRLTQIIHVFEAVHVVLVDVQRNGYIR